MSDEIQEHLNWLLGWAHDLYNKDRMSFESLESFEAHLDGVEEAFTKRESPSNASSESELSFGTSKIRNDQSKPLKRKFSEEHFEVLDQNWFDNYEPYVPDQDTEPDTSPSNLQTESVTKETSEDAPLWAWKQTAMIQGQRIKELEAELKEAKKWA